MVSYCTGTQLFIQPRHKTPKMSFKHVLSVYSLHFTPYNKWYVLTCTLISYTNGHMHIMGINNAPG